MAWTFKSNKHKTGLCQNVEILIGHVAGFFLSEKTWKQTIKKQTNVINGERNTTIFDRNKQYINMLIFWK
jgi:Fe-S cluster biosynthesis and repair protein YggX